MKFILNWVWQLPQHLLALLLWGILRLAGRIERVGYPGEFPGNVFITVRVKSWGVSLGRYIFLDVAYGKNDRKHERGHSVQSLWWGPLYLLAVGIPSAIGNNLWDRIFHKNWPAEKRIKWYYNRWPEKQADALGGAEREY